MRIAKVFLFYLILQSNSTFAEVYKWIDENGKTVYGDKPISEDADIIEIKRKPATDKAYQERAEKRQKLLDVMQDERDEKIAAENDEKEKKEKQKQECAKLKKELRETKDASLLYEETDDPNNPRIFTDEERQTEIDKYEKYINENC